MNINAGNFGRGGVYDLAVVGYYYGNSFNAITRALFANGEQGVAYDVNDLSTLFQDAAGVVPVTAADQPVRVMLDKSGRGNHVTFLSDAARPFLRLNAATGAYYLETDGVDDGGMTASIDFSGTDKVSVFTGIRKLSDATTQCLLELSSNSSGTAGAFGVFAPISLGASYQFRSGGSIPAVTAGSGIGQFPAPNTAVISAVGDISGDVSALSVNGATVGSSAADQGAGSYGNYPLYLFRRGGTTLPWAGHFYGAIIVGRLTTATEITKVQRLFAKRTGVTLA